VRYLFDTDVLSALIQARELTRLHQRLARLSLAAQCTSSITLGELCYGAHKARRLEIYEHALRVLQGVEVLPFDFAAAERYGTLRAKLERSGRRLAEADLRIACVALVNDCTLVTGNLKHFARIEGLSVENWL
jgi:predicted nucleic acid-binding protein